MGGWLFLQNTITEVLPFFFPISFLIHLLTKANKGSGVRHNKYNYNLEHTVELGFFRMSVIFTFFLSIRKIKLRKIVANKV